MIHQAGETGGLRLPSITNAFAMRCASGGLRSVDEGFCSRRRIPAGRRRCAPVRGWFLSTFGLALMFALAGCAVGPQYKGPPPTNLSGLHNSPAVAARPTTASAPPLETWWTGFHDPVLDRIVERALR